MIVKFEVSVGMLAAGAPVPTEAEIERAVAKALAESIAFGGAGLHVTAIRL